ncbi:MAG: hypothetical protein ACHQWH_00930 [Nitrososphaerales archaeon]|jgi:hypothetical protein
MNVALTTFDADKTRRQQQYGSVENSATSSLIYIRLYVLGARYSIGVSISMVLKLFLVLLTPHRQEPVLLIISTNMGGLKG